MATYYTDISDTDPGIRATKWKGIATADVDATQAENAAKLAYTIINAKLDAAYSVPFDLTPDTPGIITEISDVLTVYYMKRFTTGHALNTKQMEAEHDRVMEWLDLLAAGKMRIPGTSRSLLPDSSTRGYHPVFPHTRQVLDAGVDTDRQDDEDDERDDT